MSCEGTSGPAVPGEPPSEVLPWGSGHPGSQDGASHREGLGTLLRAGWGHWIARRSPAHENAHEDHAGARAWGWPGGLSCCSITIPVGHRGCAGTASCPSSAALPSHRSCLTSRSSVPPGPGPHIHLQQTSCCGGGEPQGWRCPERHNSGRTRDIQRGKALQ